MNIIFKTGTEEEIKAIITQELEDPIWERVLQVKDYISIITNLSIF